MKRAIDDELNAHLLDLQDDLMAQGLTAADATATAHKQFGEVAAIRQELIGIHRGALSYLWPLLGGLFIVSVIPFYILRVQAPQRIVGLLSEHVIIWWWLAFITVAAVVLARWLMQFYGLQTRFSLYSVLALALVVSNVITIVLDVDNFEVSLHGIIFALLVGGGLLVAWAKLSFAWKRRLLLLATIIIVLSALREEPIFQFALQDTCLYLTPDKFPLAGELRNCVQLQWWHPLLYPIYLELLVCGAILLNHVYRLWQSHGTALWRKLVMTSALVALPVIPLFVQDINNRGEIDIVPWKRSIYKSYVLILGRAPEQKDYDFYAQTRSYLHMSRLREVLRASEERRIKITQMYEHILDRAPTAAELDDYANSTKSIKKIKRELKQQRATLTND